MLERMFDALASPTTLRVEGLRSEEAVLSEATPRFSFVHPTSPEGKFGVRQTSYRITVAASDGPATKWDSGDVPSEDCAELVYGGSPLAPFTRYTWTAQWNAAVGRHTLLVRATDTGGNRQPVDPEWNIQGMGNNMAQTVDVIVE